MEDAVPSAGVSASSWGVVADEDPFRSGVGANTDAESAFEDEPSLGDACADVEADATGATGSGPPSTEIFGKNAGVVFVRIGLGMLLRRNVGTLATEPER